MALDCLAQRLVGRVGKLDGLSCRQDLHPGRGDGQHREVQAGLVHCCQAEVIEIQQGLPSLAHVEQGQAVVTIPVPEASRRVSDLCGPRMLFEPDGQHGWGSPIALKAPSGSSFSLT